MRSRACVFSVLTVLCGLSVQAASAQGSSNAGAELKALLAEEWKSRLSDDPLYATQAGVRDYDDRLPSVTPADYQRRRQNNQNYARRLAAIDRAALSAANRVSYDVFDFEIHHRLALSPYQTWRIPLTSDEGFHIEVMRMAIGVVMSTPRDYENYIARLHAMPAYFAAATSQHAGRNGRRLHVALGDHAGNHQGPRRPAIPVGRADAVL